ncbi:calpain-C [Lutzomyia longipalpis]|uniref:calpain-C n=1 Tax=Lutzomyia longipalpis TaxID=7200 RepID=UPI0024838B3E|nr:calpain-C [Lutzomyia longipalpis]XP_055692833.1 calpain-C [Lutzomyia longipalpis]
MTSSYERIKSECKKKNQLWEDPDFPAVQTSVFYHQTPPFTFQWKRPQEILAQPVFINDSTTQFDITPGKMGDRWLVSCLGILYLSKGLFYRVVPADQSFETPYYGVFRFRLWWCGEWVEVLVDDRLPTINGKLAFLQAQNSNSFWPGLLEKAYAKLHGSYEALKYGTLLDGLADLTGGITECIPIRAENVPIRPAIMYSLLDTTSIVTCTVNNSTNSTQIRNQLEKLPSGICVGSNYRLCSLDKAETLMGDSVQLVRLRDPMSLGNFGNGDGYNGDWSSLSNSWERVSVQERDRLLGQLDIGDFWMSFADLAQIFTHLECVHLDSDTARDEPSLSDKSRKWLMRMYQGAWRKGVTAGGCRNNPDSFHINPQLQLFLNDKEDVIISLNQHSVMEPKVIGFTLYNLSTVQNKISECLPKSFFKKHKSLQNSQYTNSRQISQRCCLDAGRYLIMATTFEPMEESAFSVRVLGSSIRLSLLETQTMLLLDPFPSLNASQKIQADLSGSGTTQYEPVFLQLADDHKTINCYDLQELLEACLPNDYIKSCASLDVCRQVVCLMDKTNRGRITFTDFKVFMVNLKSWQGVFKIHTKEKSGILRAERLRDALYDVGFQLSTEILSILVLRYMRRDGTLRLGDYVSAILHLTMAFEIFKMKDLNQDGVIKLGLAEWIKSALMC